MSPRLNVFSELRSADNSFLKRELVRRIWPETKWAIYEQVYYDRTRVCCKILGWFV